MAPKIPGGYILLARKLAESDLMRWPSHYMKLWVWMLLQANWKSRDKLDKGQFVTSIAEMQKAGGYKVGYRTRDLTKDEVRSAYEAFTKATMITTTKTTRGMVITICNYEEYQNSENYEDHNAPHDEDTTHPTGTPHDTEEVKKGKKEKKDICAKKSRAPTGDHQIFLAWWKMAYEKMTSQCYLFDGKDAKHASDILKGMSLKEAIARAAKFMISDDPFYEGKKDIGFFRSQINKVPKANGEDADQLRELGLAPPSTITFENWKFWETTDAKTATTSH
jgi:hypothetical protein